MLALGLCAASAQAGSFFSDFNGGVLPPGTALYGSASMTNLTGGWTNSGYLQLTPNAGSQNAGFVIPDLDAGTPVVGFVARYKCYIGPLGASGADGISFNYATDLPAGTMTEEGAGTGLTVAFDTYANAGESAGIDLKAYTSEFATTPWGGLRTGAWVDVLVIYNPDYTVSVMYDGFWAYTNSYLGLPPFSGASFGFGARTGGAWDAQNIDNLSIVTYTTPQPMVNYYAPVGRAGRADMPVVVQLKDFGSTQVDPNNGLTLTVNGVPVTPTVTQAASVTTVTYTPPTIFPAGSTNTVSLTYADSSTPPVTNTWQWTFIVDTYPTLSTNLIANPSLVSANSGFAIRTSQIDVNHGPSIQRAENQLAGLIIDANTGLPYPNRATMTATNEPGVINFSTAGYQGDFATESPNSIPGLPGLMPDGVTSTGDTNAALDAVTYLYLTPGLYTLGVNSSDGFRLTAASTPDLYAPEEAVYDAIRAAGDTTVTFAIAQAGYYPFRICYYIGGQELVYPTADVPNLEFFSVDAAGVKTLINDSSAANYIQAYLPAQTLPYVRSVSPVSGTTGVPKTSPLDVTLVDGSITVAPATAGIALWVNGAAVTPVVTYGYTNGGVSIIHYQPASPWVLNSSNYVQFAFTDSANNRRTNSFNFKVENILTQLFAIQPAAAGTWGKWVTSAGTERGIAFNPKTGHVLIASRNGTVGGTDPTSPNGGGVGIFDGTDGHFIGQLNMTLADGTSIPSSGLGLYKVNMVDVAEDGVIYMCPLDTSWASMNFVIYRWQNESAVPTICISSPQVGVSTRVGDDFCVRGSGAGTQIIASGNSAVTNIPMFTTVDGTNFTATSLNITGLPNAMVRLGLAFGCGNTIYGDTTGNPVRYVSFTGPPATTGILITNYPILDGAGKNYIGPIGVDIPNQRMIGASTAGTSGAAHSMNLFDLDALVAGVNNSPIDSKPFPVNVGTFGTGAVDFTPDGTRVYTLDTGSGVIAFGLAPKVAAPSICAQPRTNLVAGLGSLGFMDVMAIGAPQKFQWLFNGTPILNATNRTLDIYNVQQGNLGFYSVVVSNSLLGLSVTSSVAPLDTAMVVTNQPVSQHVLPGGTATFTVGVSNGLPAYTYQWLLWGTNVVGTGQTLTIPNVQVASAGLYSVVITDALGQQVSSASATLYVGPAGTGDGLRGDYYNEPTFTGPPPTPFSSGVFAGGQVDPTVNFDWGTGNVGPAQADYVVVRWSGKVQPLYTQTYTFYTRSDDGSALWVNGQQVVTNWFTQGPTERSGTIALTGGRLYDIVMEFYEQGVGAVAQLSWSSQSQPKEIIPQSQLYSASASPVQPNVTATRADATHITLHWDGSYVLMSAFSLDGPWTPVSGATSPYTITIDLNQPTVYFRLLSQ